MPAVSQGCMACVLLVINAVLCSISASAAGVPIDQSGIAADSQIAFRLEGKQVRVHWPIDDADLQGEAVLQVGEQRPLFQSLALLNSERRTELLRDVEPATFLTVGTREGVMGREWNVFFDKVHQRPYETFCATLTPKQVRLRSISTRGSVEIDDLTAGPFHGRLELNFFAGSPLIRVDAVMRTSEDWRAILYDAGLVGEDDCWDQVAWMTPGGSLHTSAAKSLVGGTVRAVKHRTVVASRKGFGSVAVFPPPHQFFYPLDFSNNFGFNWAGRGFHFESRMGLGIRLPPDGDRRFVPWFNAPPGTDQRMSMFVLLSLGGPSQALESVLKYTRGDRFKPLDGYRTFTSHYHVAHTMDVMKRRDEGKPTDDIPEFVSMFRQMGVNVAHLAEFHGDGNPQDRGPKRLPQLELMHQECERLSNDDFLLLPGEEPNVHLGGHWISFFPRPVHWIMSRQADEPFVADDPQYGRVYRVGNAAEMLELLRREQGLAWTAHARIKSSHGFPDGYRDQPFFLSDRFLGAAWKAMPADLSRPKLGERVLDLLDDMSNWRTGRPDPFSPKYVIGEVDVFKIDHTHELYGHMNINYLRLDKVPRFRDGWSSILDVLRRGDFFVSTGEVLIPTFSLGGKHSGDTLDLTANARPELLASVESTFPLAYAEIISGDGTQTFRERIDLSDSTEFETRTIRIHSDIANRRWLRLEVWDIASNGAFTQPVWIKSDASRGSK